MRDSVNIADGLFGSSPYICFGTGPPILAIPTLSTTNEPLSGIERSMVLRILGPVAQKHRVFVVNRPVGLAAGTAIADFARTYEEIIDEFMFGSMDVIGIGTGGMIALQLAIDYPDRVRRLVVLSSGCRLSQRAQGQQEKFAELMSAGKPRSAWRSLGKCYSTANVSGVALTGAVAALAKKPPADTDDLRVTVAAENDFDCCGQLDSIRAQTLVCAGMHDGFYTPDIFTRTAANIPGGRLLLYPRRNHLTAMSAKTTGKAMLEFFGAQASLDGGK